MRKRGRVCGSISAGATATTETGSANRQAAGAVRAVLHAAVVGVGHALKVITGCCGISHYSGWCQRRL